MTADSFERPARERRVGACLMVVSVALSGAACSGERLGARGRDHRATEATERPTSAPGGDESPQASAPAGAPVLWNGSASGLLTKAGRYRFVFAIPRAERLLRRLLYDLETGGVSISDMAVRSVFDARAGKEAGVGAVAGVMETSNPLGPDAMALLALAMAQSTTDTRFELAGRPAFLFEDATESNLVLFPADNAFILLNAAGTSGVLGVGAALGRVFEDLPVEV